ncbi:alpha-ketoglutarate-dependent dioxygenase AlkB [Vibrio rhizosphaerae]|uniref:Alpha-ketoglutarate-dependent dioxygenase AlkB n=2 Tax=Vibrio rhizosphaerae TaxID=398736 RepID=A0ABU4IT60_9VIBR|nr:alpha-ketoglutarate-dependent dioxygenase AlkB [Vibrio rhizosphaerae]MDW6092602.1 alpha-ketoglutarate-dependent dioxygenase AlkB [Vibrio rhizosphaerae]
MIVSSQNPEIIDLPDGRLRYVSSLLTETDALIHRLTTSLNWYQGDVFLFGRHHKTPRLQCWYGDKAYTYSQVRLEPTPWPPLLQQLRTIVEEASGHAFNSVLGNWYQHGQHNMGMHADNEPELGQNPVVAMLTFGTARPLQFRHRNGVDRFTIIPEDGSLLIMEGPIQHYWRHGIHKSKTISAPRISLTFRQILSVNHAHTARRQSKK